MHTNRFLLLFLCFISGCFLYAYFHELIIIRPFPTTQLSVPSKTSTKKKVILSYWNQDSWQQEAQEILWSSNKATALHYLITAWLSLMHEEKISKYPIKLQAILLTSSESIAYISFEHNPLPQESATVTALMWIESLLKTIRENKISLQGVYFLVDHQQLKDEQLDFSMLWPLNGFITMQ